MLQEGLPLGLVGFHSIRFQEGLTARRVALEPISWLIPSWNSFWACFIFLYKVGVIKMPLDFKTKLKAVRMAAKTKESLSIGQWF